jgi:hypothetical protein
MAGELVLSWSADLLEERLRPFEPWAVLLHSAPRRGNLPLRPVRRKTELGGNRLVVSVDVSDQGFIDLLEAGGVLVLDVVCDALVDDRGLPVSSSLGPLLFGTAEALVPGGSMRLALVVGG